MDKRKIGTKAKNLQKLKNYHFNIPNFFAITENFDEDEVIKQIQKLQGEKFAIRSSSSVEDSEKKSYAGYFDTYLNVDKKEVLNYIKKIITKRKENFSMGIIVQEMIQADISGVIFTANPIGILSESVIVCGYGLGENVVNNKVDVTTYYYNLIDKEYYYEKQKEAPELKQEKIEELIKISQKIKKIYKKDMDIEWCIKDNTIYILQARPITTLKKEKVIVLDNSNIVESYPGITLPLTQSFIKEAYYQVFKNCLIRLVGNKNQVRKQEDTLKNMIDFYNGRVYYRINNWYKILKFLPFSKKIISIWQEMLGVDNKEIGVEDERKISFFTHIRVLLKFFYLLYTCPSKMEKLNEEFEKIPDYFKNHYHKNMSNDELKELYYDLTEKLLENWDITLANDIYAFLFTGLLKNRLKKKEKKNKNFNANQYISQISNLESMKPVKELIDIAKKYKQTKIINIKDVEAYIDKYGDRSLNELKLESETFRTNPQMLFDKIYEYSENENIDNIIPKEENQIKIISPYTKLYLKKAKIGIRNREKSRLNRSRIYGMIRTIFLNLGENLYSQGKIEDKRDIFYLKIEEIFANTIDFKEKVKNRKEQYERYKEIPTYSRIVFDGKVINRNIINLQKSNKNIEQDTIYGTPCSQGKVEGQVLLVENVDKINDVTNKILVTKSTDPGWVFLIAQAKGIISEKGSLLSHTAIISRELNKPAIVNVRDIMNYLKTGDYIRMDGTTGKIEKLERKTNSHESNKI